MAVADHIVGFDITELDFSISNGTTTITGADFTDRLYMPGGNNHVVSSVVDTFSSEGFINELEDVMRAAWTENPIGSFFTSNLQYTISSLDSGNTYTFSQDAANLLGLSSLVYSGTTSISSDVRPYYMMRLSTVSQVSRPSHLYEAGSQASQAVSDDGDAYGVARTTAVTEEAWEVEFEPLAATLADEAASSAPFTWQHLFQHARTVYPILLSESIDNDAGIVGFIKPDFSAFTRAVRERHVESYDNYWRIRFEMIRAGTL